MNLPLDSIKSLLGAAADGTITPPEVTRLVQVSRIVVQLHLLSKKSALAFIFRRHGISATDLAYDCLGEVFIRDGGRSFGKIAMMTKSLGREFSTVGAPEVFIAYRGLLVKIADAYVAQLFALADPEGGRIYRNVREFVKRSDLFSIRRSPAGLTLAIKGRQPGPAGRLHPGEDLERECLRRCTGKQSTPDLLMIVHDVLTGSADPMPEVLLFDVVKIMKRLHGDGIPRTAWNVPPEIDGFSPEDIGRIRHEVLRSLKEKIRRTYVEPGKLSVQEAEDLFLAARDIVVDWCDGAPEYKPLHEYLAAHRPVTPGDYDARYKSKLEYIVKLARERCEAFLLREL